VKQIVIDASVALKWYLMDEENHHEAMNMLTEYIAGDLDIIGPSLLEYEVINGLIVAGRRGRIPEKDIMSAIDGFTGLGISLHSISLYYDKALDYCWKYGISLYDASYLALAEKAKAQVITADSNLYKKAGKKIQSLKWIGDRK
jgi:predicted nucleic acid-binding protein